MTKSAFLKGGFYFGCLIGVLCIMTLVILIGLHVYSLCQNVIQLTTVTHFAIRIQIGYDAVFLRKSHMHFPWKINAVSLEYHGPWYSMEINMSFYERFRVSSCQKVSYRFSMECHDSSGIPWDCYEIPWQSMIIPCKFHGNSIMEFHENSMVRKP